VRRRERELGQASVELVAVLPALLICAAIAIQLAITGYGLWASASAASAGARAAYVGGDSAGAARSALPLALRRGARVSDSRGVRVSLQVPGLLPGGERVPVRSRTELDPGADGG
jgi:pilus assembly protein CpaE